MGTKRIREGIKSVVRIARSSTSHCPVHAKYLLILPSVKGGATENFCIDDDMKLWSLIDYLKFNAV